MLPREDQAPLSVRRHPKYLPSCPAITPLVDQFSWTEKDASEHVCYNGISSPIYDRFGNINRALPLHMYPTVDAVVHPHVALQYKRDLAMRTGGHIKDHLFLRGKRERKYEATRDPDAQFSLRDQVVREGFVLSQKMGSDPRYPLASPYGDATRYSPCGGLYGLT